jgi:heme exporter protein D
MDSLSSFLDMGGYAAFIWPSFAVTAAVLAVLLYASHRFRKTNQAQLDALKGLESLGKKDLGKK